MLTLPPITKHLFHVFKKKGVKTYIALAHFTALEEVYCTGKEPNWEREGQLCEQLAL